MDYCNKYVHEIFINEPQNKGDMKRIGTKQRKTRHKLTASIRERGKISLREYFKVFQQGDSVALRLHPLIQKGRFFPRFHGFTGVVQSKKGACYEVAIRDHGKNKLVCVHPIHLLRHHGNP